MSGVERQEADPYFGWQLSANCATVGPDVMFPDKGDNRASRAARLVCAGCAVVEPCLEDAIANPEPFGYRGGKSPAEITGIRNRTAEQRGAATEAAMRARYETARALRNEGRPLLEIAKKVGYASHAGITFLFQRFEGEAS